MWSGNLHPALLPTRPFSSLSGSQWGNVVNWLYNKEKRIMHICWYSVLLFFSSFSSVRNNLRCAQSWASPSYVWVTLAHRSLRKENITFSAFCVSQFKMLQCLEFYWCIWDLWLDFLNDWSHAVWLFCMILTLASSCFYHVYQSSSSEVLLQHAK